MDSHIKVASFEYLLHQFISWSQEDFPEVSILSFTRLKSLKLLFFVSAIKNKEGNDILDIFNNFYALKNGPVESDIYNCITADKLEFYSFKDYSFREKKSFNLNVSDELKVKLDLAIDALRAQNKNIVSYSAYQLVSISHYWNAWQKAFMLANAYGKGSYRMGVSMIRESNQIFKL